MKPGLSFEKLEAFEVDEEFAEYKSYVRKIAAEQRACAPVEKGISGHRPRGQHPPENQRLA